MEDSAQDELDRLTARARERRFTSERRVTRAEYDTSAESEMHLIAKVEKLEAAVAGMPAPRLSVSAPPPSQRERIADVFGWRRGSVSDAEQREISPHMGPLWVSKDGHKNGWMVGAGVMDDGQFAAALYDANKMLESQNRRG